MNYTKYLSQNKTSGKIFSMLLLMLRLRLRVIFFYSNHRVTCSALAIFYIHDQKKETRFPFRLQIESEKYQLFSGNLW